MNHYRSYPRFISLVITGLFCITFSTGRAAADRLDFGRDILPILSDKCYHCHGPDEKSRKAKLRLDTREGAFRVNADLAVIVPGKSSESELVRRITSKDPDEQMPPPDSNRTLTAAQIDSLKSWVDQGAPWGKHWAFVPPVKPDVPTTRLAASARNPVDAFVIARLEREGLAPAPEASRERLIRRVAFDLTGLPPTPAEVNAYVHDPSKDSYEKLVDRLLASPRFGERMASDWLDLARFADTHGYQRDRYRAMWPYRDWVIKAFNENLPYDQFVTWQLAGDLLPNATKEQRLATAFNRLHMQNEEGGIVEEEFRVAYVVDRVDTMGTAFLALTFECCRCHDHKFDPIKQKEFYQLFSLFQNIDESGQTTFFTESVPVPTLLLSTDEQDAKLARVRRDSDRAAERLKSLSKQAAGPFEEWLRNKPSDPAIPGLVASFSFEKIDKNQVANSVQSGKPGKLLEQPAIVPGKEGNAAALDGDDGFAFHGVGSFTRADPFSLALWIRTPHYAPREVIVHKSKAPIDAGSRGYEILLEDGRIAFGLHHMWPGNSLKVVTRDQLTLNEWEHVAVTYDGSSRASGIHVFLDGRSVELEVIRDGLCKEITYEESEPDLTIGERFRDNGFKGGFVDEFRVFDRALTPLEVTHVAGHRDFAEALECDPGRLTPAQREGLREYFLAVVFQPALAQTAKLHALRVEASKFVEPIPEVMVMKELDQPKPAYVLKRGAYDAPSEQVLGDTPAALPSFPTDQPRNRLGLARWLLASDHPLTARVTVNRLWQQMFGRGIVETSENFGSQGAQPSHPELLDWLACSFVDDMHWDVKAMLKLIAMSATYRQSSLGDANLMARDPGNELLARGPSRRLTAEMLRDQSLLDAGLLVETMGGPSVKPYQPEGIWDVATGSPKYDQGHGDDLHRRSLYTYWKRTVPPPTMVAFDAADRSYCTARRQSTSTPLQALALLNDVQMVEAARHVSERMLKEGGGSLEQRVAWAFQLVTGRPPTDKETAVLVRLFQEQRGFFQSDYGASARLLAMGESKNDPALDQIDLAAGTVLAEALFNQDEAIMRR